MNQRILLLIAMIALLAVSVGAYTVFNQKQSPTDVTPSPSPTLTPTPTLTPSQTTKPTPTPKPSQESKASALHIDLWRNTTETAISNRTYAYAIYACRTIAVVHPEVYLLGDSIFIREITSGVGYQKAYEIKNVTDPYFEVDEPLSGPSFSFSDVNFQAYSLVQQATLYPQGYPTLTYLDRRMSPIACALKTTGNTLTQIELAEQYYFKTKTNQPTGRVFIIYCDNENAYILSDGGLTSMTSQKEEASVVGNPVLIFDEQGVWYPLMGRDDSASDVALKQVVTRFSTSIKMPSLSEVESRMLIDLRNATALSMDRQFTLAELSAAHTQMTSIGTVNYVEFKAVWDKTKIPNRSAMALFMAINRVANYLSPITAR